MEADRIEAFKELVREHPIFQNLEAEELELLAQVSVYRGYIKGNRVFEVDNEGKYFYIVREGEFRLWLKNAVEVPYRRGDVFGEIAALSDFERLGTVKAIGPAGLFAIPTQPILDDQHFPPAMTMKLLRALIRHICTYIHAFPGFKEPVKALIEAGEGERVEFKESISNDSIRKLVKTAVAYMNTAGGVILIGVRNDKEIIGLPDDKYELLDDYRLKFFNQGRRSVGKLFYNLVSLKPESLDNKQLIRIDCRASDQPVFLMESGEKKFYKRVDGSNRELDQIELIVEHMVQKRLKM